jgi:hypothetical protein
MAGLNGSSASSASAHKNGQLVNYHVKASETFIEDLNSMLLFQFVQMKANLE